MKKTSGLACTVGFALLWVCGGMAAIAVATGQAVEPPLVALAGLGGILGVMARLRLVQETRDIAVGVPASASEQLGA